MARPDMDPEGERRDALLDAVIEIVSEQGFERTTMRNLAARAGVSTGLLNYYFQSRQGLVTEAILRSTRRVEALHDTETLPPGAPRIEATIRRSLNVAFTENLPLTFRLQVFAAAAVGAADPELRTEVCRLMEKGRGKYRESVVAAVTSGAYRADIDPEQAATLLYGALTGLTVQNAIAPTMVSSGQVIDATLLLLRLMEGAQAAPSSRADTPEAVEACLMADPRLSATRAGELADRFRSLYEDAVSGAGGGRPVAASSYTPSA
jgi:AcrR family transcriptional regulator